MKRDAVVALALLLCGVLLRLPLIGLGETVEEALDPLSAALALRDRFEFAHPGFFHFGYGRDLSFLPFVINVDGLVDAQTRRSLFQALIGPLVFLGARRWGAGVVAAGTAALLLVTSEEFLHTGVSGHETYLSAEWVALAVLLAAGRGRSAAIGTGGALAMGLMSHPFVLPALAVFGLVQRSKAALAAFGVVLLPQVWRVAAAILSGVPLEQILLVQESRPLEGPTGDLVAYLRGGLNIDVLVLLLAPLVVAVARRGDRRFRRVAALGVGLVLAEVLLVGWAEGWYWRPTAPWFAVCLAVATSSRRWWTQAAVAGAATWLAVASVQRTDAAYERTEEGIKYADHVAAVAEVLVEAGQPVQLLTWAEDDGMGRRSDVRPIEVHLELGGRRGVLTADPSAPVFLHLAGSSAEIARRSARGELRLRGREVALVEIGEAPSDFGE